MKAQYFKYLLSAAAIALVVTAGPSLHSEEPPPSQTPPAISPQGDYALPNPQIDFSGFLAEAKIVEGLRANRRVSEKRFIEMVADPTVIVLDARSAEAYRLLHVKGALNLPLPDFNEASLAAIIPDKTTRILIYCNNNFQGEEQAMTAKTITASLNIYTFSSLYAYGYQNVYELGPLRDIRETPLRMAGELAPGIQPLEKWWQPSR
jgi:rhodanese-related sulfurtransferase